MKKLGFGFMRLPLLDGKEPTSFDRCQICGMVDAYLAAGFTYFDTAYMYHAGKSEEMLRAALVERYPREKFLLADKLPTMFLKEPEDVPRIFAEQLERTGAGWFDYYLLHCLDKNNYPTAERLHCFDFVMEQKKKGLVKRFGFSFHDTPELLDEILTAHPEVEFVQLQINYLDWENPHVQSRRCYETAVRHGKDVIVMEPVKGGALANVPPLAESLLKAHAPEQSTASWAIRYAASLPAVIMVLSGMSSIAQLTDNITYMRDFQPLTEEETAICGRVRDIINHEIEIGCTACHYCTDECPAAIPIPEYFALYNKKAEKDEYAALSADRGKASECLQCGQCEGHCPQHLPVIGLLQRVAARFEE